MYLNLIYGIEIDQTMGKHSLMKIQALIFWLQNEAVYKIYIKIYSHSNLIKCNFFMQNKLNNVFNIYGGKSHYKYYAVNYKVIKHN